MTNTVIGTISDEDLSIMVGQMDEHTCSWKNKHMVMCGKKAEYLQVHLCCGRDFFRCGFHVKALQDFLATHPDSICVHCRANVENKVKFVPLNS